MSNVPETKVDPSLSTPEVPSQALHSRLDKMRADSTILGSMNKILGEYHDKHATTPLLSKNVGVR